MNREQIRKIIGEEIRRALQREEVPAPHSPDNATSPSPALLVLSGGNLAAEALLGVRSRLAILGWSFELLLSRTFRETALPGQKSTVASLGSVLPADDEAAESDAVERARWLLLPDLSDNALSKSVLGIADSAPTRALALAMRLGRPCLLLETRPPTSPVVGLGRLEKLRKLERHGAVLTNPENLFERMKEALLSAEEHYFPPATGGGPRSQGRRIVTSEELIDLSRRGQTRLIIPVNAIVTHHTRDEAERRGIEIVFSEDAT